MQSSKAIVAPLTIGSGPFRVAIKDCIDIAGVPTRAGSRAYADAGPATRDASIVRNLRAGQCRLVGKANMHELAFGVTGINDWTGTPLNPLFRDRVPGGSSSGSASAVAGGLVDFAIGSDAGPFQGLNQVPLFDDHAVLAVHVGQPATWREILEMLDAPHIAVVGPDAEGDPVDAWLAERGLHRRIAAVVPHYLQALMAVSRTDLVAILPSRLVAAYGAKLDVRAVELPIEQGMDRHFLFTAVERDADPANLWLRDLIKRTAGS